MGKLEKDKKIGILGGTFDPIHYGHLILAQQSKEELELSKVIFIPCFSPPHKNRFRQASPQERFEMTKLATEDNPFFVVSNLEIKRRGTSYTVDTLKELKDLYKDSEIFFLIGADNLPELSAWKSPQTILSLAQMVIATRPGFNQIDSSNQFVEQSILIQITGFDISSTEIRDKVKTGKSIRYLVPPQVEQYIKEKGLYK